MKFGVHAPSGLPTVEAAGEPRVLACLKPNPFNRYAPAYTGQDVPESDWHDIDAVANGWLPDIYDQDGQGSCVGHGSVLAFTVAWRRTGNNSQIRFSPCFLYSLINGGRDQGAIVEDAMHALEETGVCLESTVGPKQIFPAQFDRSKATTEAGRFKIEQAETLKSFNQAMSAVQTGSVVSFGIDIGNNFEPDSNGVIPRQSGGGGGHCMAWVGAKKINGVWYAQVANSWSTKFGVNGICYMQKSYFDQYMDAFRIDAAFGDPQDPQGPVAQ